MPERPGPGRPIELDDQIDTTPTGEPVTVADRILEWAGIAFRADWAAARAGITRATFERWSREAVRIRAHISMNPDTINHLTHKEQRLLQFGIDLDRAAAEGIGRFHMALVNVGRGGRPVTVRTRKFVQGQLVEETERTETTAPDPKVLMWLLERGAPELYGPHLTVDVVPPPDPLSRGERQSGLARIIEGELAAGPLTPPESNGNGHA